MWRCVYCLPLLTMAAHDASTAQQATVAEFFTDNVYVNGIKLLPKLQKTCQCRVSILSSSLHLVQMVRALSYCAQLEIVFRRNSGTCFFKNIFIANALKPQVVMFLAHYRFWCDFITLFIFYDITCECVNCATFLYPVLRA